jgi:hypothetical protein
MMKGGSGWPGICVVAISFMSVMQIWNWQCINVLGVYK